MKRRLLTPFSRRTNHFEFFLYVLVNSDFDTRWKSWVAHTKKNNTINQYKRLTPVSSQSDRFEFLPDIQVVLTPWLGKGNSTNDWYRFRVDPTILNFSCPYKLTDHQTLFFWITFDLIEHKQKNFQHKRWPSKKFNSHHEPRVKLAYIANKVSTWYRWSQGEGYRFIERRSHGIGSAFRPSIYVTQNTQKQSQNVKKWKMYSEVFRVIFFAVLRHFFHFLHFTEFRAWVGIHVKSQRIPWFIFLQH